MKDKHVHMSKGSHSIESKLDKVHPNNDQNVHVSRLGAKENALVNPTGKDTQTKSFISSEGSKRSSVSVHKIPRSAKISPQSNFSTHENNSLHQNSSSSINPLFMNDSGQNFYSPSSISSKNFLTHTNTTDSNQNQGDALTSITSQTFNEPTRVAQKQSFSLIIL